MLLVSDRDGDVLRLAPPSGFVRLGQPHGPLPPFDRIVCDVALDEFANVEALRDLLATLRPSADVPLHIMLREGTIFTRAIANALGATTISEADDPSAKFVVAGAGGDATAPKRLSAATPEASGTQPADPASEIGVLAASFARIFEAAANRRALADGDLELAVGSLLRSVRRSKVGPWIDVVRRYDDATYQHCLLVAGLTAAFAMRLGLSTPTQRMLAQAAILHDIGKAKVPLAVLNKPGPLTLVEQAMMRRHPIDGYYMLDRQPGLLAGVRDVVRYHHEMLDGSGYPEGLRKGEIAEPVRIVTICDVGAALIERRPYRPALSGETAYATMLSMGDKLDAGLLAAFEDVLKAAADTKTRAA